jgi:hypothetical protein
MAIKEATRRSDPFDSQLGERSFVITANDYRRFAASQRVAAKACSAGLERERHLAAAARYEAVANDLEHAKLNH